MRSAIRRLLVSALSAFLVAASGLLAGCAEPTTPMLETTPELVAPPPETPGTPMVVEEVYDYTGRMQGVSNVTGSESLAETFEAPAGTVGLEFRFVTADASAGIVRIEVLAPNGTLAYRSDTFTQAGYYLVTSFREQVVPGLGPGAYTVRYFVTGAFDLSFKASATIEVSP